jgi:NADH-quinone oxidoreductase subunit J
MLVGVDSSESLTETIRGQRITAVVVGIGFGVLLIAVIGSGSVTASAGLADANRGGNVEGLAALIFTRYLWAFELTSALLITAALGAMVLAHRERSRQRRSQRQLAEERFRPGGHPTTLPGPGVFAHHNSVDIQALLPDGSPAVSSVSSVLRPHFVAARQSNSATRPHLQLVTPSPDRGVEWVDEWALSSNGNGREGSR